MPIYLKVILTTASSAQVRARALRPFNLCLLAVLTGVVAGVGAVLFRHLIGLIHNLSFFGQLSYVYNADYHTPGSSWGPLVIFIPVAGAAIVAFLVSKFAPEAKGHGVPEVMDAIYYARATIRPIVALIKALASAISIGTGGSVGREGPIVQIGSAFGSTAGQLLNLIVKQRITLTAAGAGAGIAATFNTPIGGVLFAAELLLHEISVWTVVPVVLSTATAAYIGRLAFGNVPSFSIPPLQAQYFHLTNPAVLLLYLGLGLAVGVLSALFIRAIYSVEDRFDSSPLRSYYLNHMVGMSIVGIMMYLCFFYLGHYYIEGVGYASVLDILTGKLSAPLLLLILFFLKLLATSITLGSGGSGGIFSPSLFLGATVGCAYGTCIMKLFPAIDVNPIAFAVVAMAGMVGGTTGAALTAIVMIFEMTLDYSVVLPMTVTVAAAYGVRKLICKDSVYTHKLIRRGHFIPEALQANVIGTKKARDLMSEHFHTFHGGTSAELPTVLAEGPSALIVEDGQQAIRVLSPEAAQDAAEHPDKQTQVWDIATTPYVVVAQDEEITELIDIARDNYRSIMLVTNDGKLTGATDIRGIISSKNILEALATTASLFSER